MDKSNVFVRVSAMALSYQVLDYLQYEHAEPEDTVKKHLEMANLLAAIDFDQVEHALDIGTATCRYPSFLQNAGVKAFGIDLVSHGYDYMSQTHSSFKFRRFLCADGLQIPMRDASMDLVTCMMGTYNHIHPELRPALLSEVIRVLEYGGLGAFGIWDGDCPFQSYLRMYSEDERELLRRQQTTQRAFGEIAWSVGFSSVRTVSFNCFPDRLVYDLGLQQVTRRDVERLAAVDLGARGRHPRWAGQMFLAICRK
jgi:SAM-dependent methyltransferase